MTSQTMSGDGPVSDIVTASDREVLRLTREGVANQGNIKPELSTYYYPFPFSRKVVVDFKTWVFLIDKQAQGKFKGGVENFLSSLGYEIPRTMFNNTTYSSTTYSRGLLIGITRPLLRIKLKRAEAAIYLKDFGNLLYVSLRVAYKQSISLLRLTLFVIICMLPSILFDRRVVVNYPWAGNLESLCADYNGCYDYHLGWLLVDTLSNMIALGLVLSIISFVRGNGFFGWLFVNYDELYRDDMATVWNMSELAIISTADAMDLAQVPVGDDSSGSSFQRTQLPKRKSRF